MQNSLPSLVLGSPSFQSKKVISSPKPNHIHSFDFDSFVPDDQNGSRKTVNQYYYY